MKRVSHPITWPAHKLLLPEAEDAAAAAAAAAAAVAVAVAVAVAAAAAIADVVAATAKPVINKK